MALIDSLPGLQALYREPLPRVVSKKRPSIDAGFREVLAASPFVLLATADAEGRCDVSPRGGPPGFVRALDDHRLAIPDLNGNNLVDSLRNIVDNPHAGLLVVVPGQEDTLRIDGRAHLTTDDEILDLFVEEFRRPVLAIVIEIETAFSHCSKAFRRSHLWDPSTWRDADERLVLAARHRQIADGRTFGEYAAEADGKIAADLAADLPDGVSH